MDDYHFIGKVSEYKVWFLWQAISIFGKIGTAVVSVAGIQRESTAGKSLYLIWWNLAFYSNKGVHYSIENHSSKTLGMPSFDRAIFAVHPNSNENN